MRCGRLHRPQHREIAAQTLGVAQILQPMTRGGNRLFGRQRALLQAGQLLRAQVHADAEFAGQCDVAVEQQLRACTAAQAQHLLQQGLPACRFGLPRT